MARRAVIQPSAHALPELRAVALAVKAAPREVRSQINKATRLDGNVIWREEVARAAVTKLDRRVLVKGARIKAGNPPIAYAATSRRPLSGGLIPEKDYAGIEFGSRRRTATTTYQRKYKGGKAHKVTRRTRAQLPGKPARGTGRVIYKAWYKSGPRIVSLWTQTVFRIIYESFGE